MMRKFAVCAGLLSLILLTSTGALAQGTLVTVDGAKLKQTVAKQKGKVVVVNFWATWCVSCVAEMPSFVKLQKAYASRGVQVAFVTIDEASAKAKAAAKLKSLGATSTTNAIVAAGSAEKTVKALIPDWPGAVPITLVYAKSGKLAQRIDGKADYATVEAAVKKALGGK